MSGFVHLHVHTQYSLLQGAMQVEDLLDRAKALGMDALAITDMHNLFGVVDFYFAARERGIKPILGCEVFYHPEGRVVAVPGQQPKGPRAHHLVLLCKDLEGYRNLCKLVSQTYLDSRALLKEKQPAGAPPRAIVDRALLDRYGDGLVVLSGCIRGELAWKALSQEEAEAAETIQWFKRRFGEDFYLELQDTGLPEQDQVNQTLQAWGEKHGVACVATVDCHYLEPEHAEAHEVLQCIEHGKNLDLDRPKSLVPPEFYLKSGETMEKRFGHFPEALANTRRVAEKCDVVFKFKDEQGRQIYHLPNFRPEGLAADAPFDLLEYFREQAREGLKRRFSEPAFAEKVGAADWPELQARYETRLEEELAMIARTGFAGYFLIVADFINWAKRHDIPVGPGRGSGAGSLAAYSLRITDIDPIEFKLLFERFINPERISMPDFDVDFCQDRRGEVIDYVSRKYGAENVCQIITFGKLQARAVIKDVARVLGLSFADSDAITKLLPTELNITLSRALELEPRLKERMESDPKVAQVMDYALKLEGLYRSAGIHAAGVIITEQPVVSYCPLYVGKDGDVVTQFDKDFAEKIGLVKYDFLGLKTLTVIDNAVRLVREGAGPGTADAEFALERINYKDPRVFDLISSGDTDGVFQVESSGMKDLCMRIQPGSLEDITAINALYRPGPLGSGMVDDFIERKHGRNPIVYEVEALAPILKDTYGVILYQEQVMQIARELAGYSLGQADLLRRAMGKKKPEEMAKHQEIFVKGATEKGLPAEKASGIFNLMAKFAEYGFNKSHSAAYGVLTYQTAYLKRYYPAEFMAALMTTEMDDTDKITKYITNARENGIPVLPPDVNRSQKRFSVERVGEGVGEKRAIRFGLEGVKGVGGIAVDAILEARASAPFRNALEFCQRVPTRKVNKKVLESLTLSGAFDSIAEVNRASLFASLEKLLEHAGDEQQERELGQSSLFDSFGSDEIKLVTPTSAIFKQEEDWPSSKKLAMEKQVVGFYVSGHPLDPWQRICEEWLGWSTERVKEYVKEKAAKKAAQPASAAEPHWGAGEGGFGSGRFRAPKTEVRLAALISSTREVMTKKGARMAFGEIEDLRGKLEVVFFPEAYAQLGEVIRKAMAENEPVVVTAEVEAGEESPKLLAKGLDWVAEAHKARVQQVVLTLDPKLITAEQLRAVKKSLIENRGKCPVKIAFIDPAFQARLDLPKSLCVSASPQLVSSINAIFGSEVVTLR